MHNTVRGGVKSKCNRSLNAKVTLEVFKCDKHGDEIKELKDGVSLKEEQLSETELRHSNSKQRHAQINTEIDTLKINIEQRKAEIAKLACEYLTMEECVERFPQY